jgi:Serine dehydrogenase proteinase
MAKKERLKLIEKIEETRGSRVISYITSTRRNLENNMAMDVPRKIFEHLRSFGAKKVDKIDLFLHSNGGDGTVPWRLVTLIREYAKSFAVLVPYKAFSAATLTALGAEEIIMHPMGMLGPTDANISGPFNPPHPFAPGQLLGINVEDVTAYIALLREDAGINHEEEFVQAFKELATRVHPLALGSVKRFLSQSRMMAKKLLELHMDQTEHQHDIEQIVENLTSKLFFHGHPINRSEARDQVGLKKVMDASPTLEKLMWGLYEEYEEQMKLEDPFEVAMEFVSQFPSPPQPPAVQPIPPPQALQPVPEVQPAQAPQAAQIPPHLAHLFPGGGSQFGPQITKPAVAKLAYVESSKRTDVLTMDYKLSGAWQPNGAVNVMLLLLRQGWGKE